MTSSEKAPRNISLKRLLRAHVQLTPPPESIPTKNETVMGSRKKDQLLLEHSVRKAKQNLTTSEAGIKPSYPSARATVVTMILSANGSRNPPKTDCESNQSNHISIINHASSSQGTGPSYTPQLSPLLSKFQIIDIPRKFRSAILPTKPMFLFTIYFRHIPLLCVELRWISAL